MKYRLAIGVALAIGSMHARAASEICGYLNGAKIIAQDRKNTYLGKISSSYDSDSIFNDYGRFGNDFSGESIWNEYSEFGNEYNSSSPFNQFTTKPPMLIKDGKIVGYLSANKSVQNSIAPNLLTALCKDEL